jgi:hypothetical protein
MSLSASTCLTYTGTTPLGQTLYVFSNVDAYSTYFTTIPLSAITGNNCPYLITGIPDGTTSIRLQDYATGCCVTIPIQCSSDFCNTCDLDFTLLSASTVSQIVAGNLTGSCENITDYVIYWYGPNSTTEVGYVSGFGSEFDYQFPHPLTGTSAIFAQGGTYIPVIDKVIISGYTFSQTGGTGYIANLNCFGPITVESLKCNNGNTVGDYSHVYQFNSSTSGEIPQPLSASFELSSNTKFFAYQFRGFSVYDKLDLTLQSSNYPVPIVLESIYVGQDSPVNGLTTFPRGASNSSSFKRVLTLTAFTISAGDFLSIEITPNTANTQTNWIFSCECLEDFDCSGCLTNQFKNNPYPIVLSSVTATTGTCDATQISFQLTGCSLSNSIDDTYKYLFFSQYGNLNTSVTTNGIINSNFTLRWSSVTCNAGGGFSGPTCRAPNTNVITYQKTIVGGIGEITITCSDYSDLNSFYTEYYNNYNLYGGSSTNPLSNDYYRALTLFVPTPLSSNCGDGTTFTPYPFHYSSTVTTGGTGPWFIKFTMPTISNSLPSFSACDINCESSLTSVINSINNASTGTSNNFVGTTTTGSKYINNTQFQVGYVLFSYINQPQSATTIAGSISIYDYIRETIPWSGVSNTYINNLSGETCISSGLPKSFAGSNFGYFINKTQYRYYFELTNPSDIKDYDIYGSRITNGAYSGFPGTTIYELAVRYSGGSVTYSNPYFVI